MRYWDSSAVIALHIQQAATPEVRDLYATDADVLTWVLSLPKRYREVIAGEHGADLDLPHHRDLPNHCLAPEFDSDTVDSGS